MENKTAGSSNRRRVRSSQKDVSAAIASAQDALATTTEYWKKLAYDRWFNSVCAFLAFAVFLVAALLGASYFLYYILQLPITNLGPAEIAQSVTRVILFGTIVA